MRLFISLSLVLLLSSCSVQKHVKRSTTTTETTTERVIDTVITVTPPVIVATTAKDSLIRAIMRDSVYLIPDGRNMIEIATKNGKVKITVKAAPVNVKVQMHETTHKKEVVKTKTKDVKRVNYWIWYLLGSALLVGIVFYRRFVR